jgi:hypothetical protein
VDFAGVGSIDEAGVEGVAAEPGDAGEADAEGDDEDEDEG